MPAPPLIPPRATAAGAIALFEARGWRLVATGDWSWVLAGGSRAARVTPFDPGYRMFAEDCLAGPRNRWLPRIDEILPLAGDGHVVMMERLHPADEARARAFCAALGIANDSGYDPPPAGPFEADADFEALRERLRTLLAQGAARFKLWGGSDIRPANVMADAAGALKLVDPVFVRGRSIVSAIAEGRREDLSDFTQAQLEAFLTIPVFAPGAETEALRARLAGLYAA